ncbi:hypothetical protein NE237_032336 [Protea cynaroides]|uniref:DUF4283 domain-containing protein n=1 Tax=Protea cynaroides TaxID=273540 RepID=A0A9Q0L358_9MAGN|nr:hypothetical protein NE237_032336 [Protea cynaroides]
MDTFLLADNSFKFLEIADLQRILEHGVYQVANRPVFIWERGVQLHIHGVKTVPLWISMPGLSLYFWSRPAFRKVVQYDRKPEQCSECKVFRHKTSTYPRLAAEIGNNPNGVKQWRQVKKDPLNPNSRVDDEEKENTTAEEMQKHNQEMPFSSEQPQVVMQQGRKVSQDRLMDIPHHHMDQDLAQFCCRRKHTHGTLLLVKKYYKSLTL